MRRAQDRARSARSRKNGARSADFLTLFYQINIYIQYTDSNHFFDE